MIDVLGKAEWKGNLVFCPHWLFVVKVSAVTVYVSAVTVNVSAVTYHDRCTWKGRLLNK